MKTTRGMAVDDIANRRVAIFEDRECEFVYGVVISADPATRRVRIQWDDGEISSASMDRGLMLVDGE